MIRLLAHLVAAWLPLAIRDIRIDESPAGPAVRAPRPGSDAVDGDAVLRA